ncbi:hypothetical protein OW763_00390 [Clostridium aestuarii]|uniref:Uncharacterized protein n=1 Tax=Clostridium aestuarii TaxID=338193 RepID=A0ABT4CV13_9CLOT|nr:hypothetical protein [Clostridium aestuarii]MCY6482816.1 hypothetical protein [Clostridium aestuarii]
MKKIELYNILSKFDFNTLINQNLTPTEIHKKIYQSCEEANSPSPSPNAIKTYIKNNLNLQWKKKKWISYPQNDINNTKGKKKSIPNPSDNITTSHKGTIDEENNHTEEKTASPNQINNDTKAEEKSNTICRKNENNTEDKSEPINNIKQNKSTSKRDTSINTVNFRDEDIDASQYAEYITAFGTEKISISISSFVLDMIEQRICKKYNIKRKGNRSKIIQIALTEYLRITK